MEIKIRIYESADFNHKDMIVDDYITASSSREFSDALDSLFRNVFDSTVKIQGVAKSELWTEIADDSEIVEFELVSVKGIKHYSMHNALPFNNYIAEVIDNNDSEKKGRGLK